MKDFSVRDLFQRSIMFYGEEGLARLQRSFVAVVGLGGVGSHAAEALARAGIGRLRIVDCDVIKMTDVNRQVIALTTTVGERKVDAMKERLLAINPGIELDSRHAFFHSDTATELITEELDFVIDAIDSLNPKGELIRRCTDISVPTVSCLGASVRSDPFQIKIAALDETAVCPLARALRRHLRSRRIPTDIPVIFSTENPRPLRTDMELNLESKGAYERGRPRQALPSLSTMPAIFGLIAANYVIMELLHGPGNRQDGPSPS
ncbi:MAG: tRNA threonylcarbamoyladenosine dehydratase [Smithellaceae bacterium]|nr:tRNA threonylcarbamoyladenosine dehydratase [Smithellaceae bacterium]